MFFLGFFLWSFTEVTTAQQGPPPPSPPPPPPPLLLVSFDGFRADYLKRFPMPNLKLLYSQGVLVQELTNVFITKTFPNHYSLVTGLYAESHGIVGSSMYDPDTHKYFHPSSDLDPVWWQEAEPLWITALDSGLRTATAMWPGSDVTIGNRTATHFLPYNGAVTFRQRLGNVTQWLLGNDEESGVKFVVMYWEEPDRTGHMFGPENDTAMSKALKEVDDNIGLMMSELKRIGLWGRVNVIVTSDHGMAQCSPERLIRLDDCLHPDNYTLVDVSPVAALVPRQDTEAVFNLLNDCHAHMTAYMKKSIPERLHYRNNRRIQPIILLADEGWTIVQRGDRLPQLGDHGYDNSLPSMHPFFAAAGPGFRGGVEMSELKSVDIYPLMCHLLSVTPRPNNGSLEAARPLLAAQCTAWDVSLVFTLGVGVALFLLTMAFVFRWVCRCYSPGSTSFQRLQTGDDDDDDDDEGLFH
ncbi:bis(5'-adenosyl)-triphosphatase enpp4 [Solea solea]|uniref:bis(5'-adenosyl)-triphosphatase enpp4 n=1 Tax=Solea solea TaxID=90069 RepID=UPI00272A462F|nr:bis(5'-adenosyl)-triphosphatase enpp4 [Solea solea]